MQTVSIEEALGKLKRASPLTRRLLQLTAEKFGGHLPEIVLTAALDRDRWSEIIPQQAAQWLMLTNNVAGTILTGHGRPSDFAVGWIRLQQTMTEIHPYFQKKAKLVRFFDLIENDAMRTIISAGHEIFSALEELMNGFSREEKVLIEYERHCNAHVFQEHYRYDVDLDGEKVVENRTARKKIPLIELDRIIREELEKFKGDERQALASFLERAKPSLERSVKAIPLWLTRF